MRIFQFIDEYCQDLVEEHNAQKALLDLSELPHDGFVTDASDSVVPVIFIDGESVPVSDVITSDRDDFVNMWKLPSAGETYDNYMALLEITEGADVVNRIRNKILGEQSRLSSDIELMTTI